ncbi:AI-2E family transporter [Jeotgalibacillus proteolyticus]|uniref:AI-2E family transporter n=1 Tax=Jeotgalibacillus proteolyticus TaxID=2082395 RepID=UPI003CF7D0DA
MNQSAVSTRILWTAAAMMSLAAVFILAYTYMLPVLAGAVIAFILYYPAKWLTASCRIPFSLSIIITILAFCSLIAGLIAVFGFLFWHDIVRFIEQIPGLFSELSTAIEQSISYILPMIAKAEAFLLSKGVIEETSGDDVIHSLKDQAVVLIQNFGEILFIELSRFLSSLPGIAVGGVIALISAYFFIKEASALKKVLKPFFGSALSVHISSLIKAVKFYTWSYVQAQMLLTAITAVIVLCGLLILDVKGAPAIALTSALLDLIPIVGTSLLFIPWVFYCWVSGDMQLMIGLLITQTVISLSRQVLEPKIIGQTLGIHPFITFLIIYISFQSVGVMGVLFSPLILLTVSTLIKAGTIRLIWIYIKKGTIL